MKSPTKERQNKRNEISTSLACRRHNFVIYQFLVSLPMKNEPHPDRNSSAVAINQSRICTQRASAHRFGNSFNKIVSRPLELIIQIAISSFGEQAFILRKTQGPIRRRRFSSIVDERQILEATQVIYFRVSLRHAAIMTDEIKFRLTAVKSQRCAAKMNHFRRPAHRLSFFYTLLWQPAGWLTGKVALTQRRRRHSHFSLPSLASHPATTTRDKKTPALIIAPGNFYFFQQCGKEASERAAVGVPETKSQFPLHHNILVSHPKLYRQ